MGSRREQRIAIEFPVVVRGTDARGNPFAVTTETHDVSCTGACLKGLQAVAEPGRKIEIECQTQKAWYRVQWAGAANRIKDWRVGVHCLEPGKYIWGVPPKEWEPDLYEPAAVNAQPPPPSTGEPVPAPVQEPQRERRRFARHACRLEAHVSSEGAYGPVMMKGTITDISLGGCYVEMLAPLPESTPVEITFSTGESPLRITARVCSSQDGFGMGLAFTGMSPEAHGMLLRFAPPTKDPRKIAGTGRYAAPHAGAPSQKTAAPISYAPASSAAHLETHQSPSATEFGPLDLPDAAMALEALVRLLLRKKVFSLSELLDELERLKAAQT